MIAGLLLGVVYQVTKNPIAEQEALAKQEACQEVFADAASFGTIGVESVADVGWNEEGYGRRVLTR